MMKPDENKILQALNYLANKRQDKTINKMSAYKLLWLADRYHARRHGRPITFDTICALPHGLVPSKAMNIIDNSPVNMVIAKSSNVTLKSISAVETKVFSKTDLDVLDLIYDTFGKYKPLELSDISHQFPDWIRFEDKLNNPSCRNSYPIQYSDYFEEVTDKRCNGLFLNDDKELLSITKEMFFSLLN